MRPNRDGRYFLFDGCCSALAKGLASKNTANIWVLLILMHLLFDVTCMAMSVFR